MSWMEGMGERGIKETPQDLGLSNWKVGVV